MRIDILTLFPGMFAGPLDDSIVRRAREGGFLDLRVHNLRDYARDKHKMVDDRPFGGGPGMLLKPEPLFEAVESIDPDRVGRVILTDPGGRRLDQSIVEELANSTGCCSFAEVMKATTSECVKGLRMMKSPWAILFSRMGLCRPW